MNLRLSYHCDIFSHMTLNIVVHKQNNKPTTQLLRDFSQRVRTSGIIPHVRNIRYRERKESDFLKKRNALRRLRRREQFNQLIKEGVISSSTIGKRIKWRK